MWCGVSNWCVCGSDRSRDACQQNGCPYAAITRDEFTSCIGHDDRAPPQNTMIRKILRVLLLQANMTVLAGFGYHFTDVAPRDMSVGLHGRHPPPHASGWGPGAVYLLPLSPSPLSVGRQSNDQDLPMNAAKVFARTDPADASTHMVEYAPALEKMLNQKGDFCMFAWEFPLLP